MKVERSIQITAPLSRIFPLIMDFKNWSTWSPWLILDPEAKVKIHGAPGAMGHKQTWEGRYIGSGEITITQIKENEIIAYDLVFLKPFKSHSRTNFSFHSSGDKVTMTWTMDGTLPFFIFFLKKMMIGLVGNDFERGLKLLKDHAEGLGQQCRLKVLGVQRKAASLFLGKERHCQISEIQKFAGSDFAEVQKILQERKIPLVNGKTLIRAFNFGSGKCHYLAGFEVKSHGSLDDSSVGMVPIEIPEHSSLDIAHYGPYRHIGNAWSMAVSRQRIDKIKRDKSVPEYETYISMPGQVAETEIETIISIPIRAR